MPPGASGSLLYQNPPHEVDIYLPSAPTRDSGGGVKLNWPTTPSQRSCPCSINTNGAQTVSRQSQGTITVNNQIAFLSSALDVTLVQGTKLVAKDTGRTFIIQGLRSPNRPYGSFATDIPAFTYCNCDEIL